MSKDETFRSCAYVKKEKLDGRHVMELSDYKISIIIPVYNTKSYLNECIGSLTRQSHENIEIILIDDGSIDGSDVVCDDWRKRDRRIIVQHEDNKGVSHARNIGINIASGDYISFVDSDDWVDIDYYEQQLSAAVRHSAEVCITGYIEDGDKKIRVGEKRGKTIHCHSVEMLTRMIAPNEKRTGFFSICAKLWKRELFTCIKLREDIYVGEDSLVSWQLMRKADTAIYIPIYGYHYRQRHGSTSHSIDVDKALSGIIAFRSIYVDAYTVSEDLGRGAYMIYLNHLMNVSKQILQSGSKEYKKELQIIVKEIRGNLGRILMTRGNSWRVRLGSIYLCLPLCLCYTLRGILVEKGRNVCSR